MHFCNCGAEMRWTTNDNNLNDDNMQTETTTNTAVDFPTKQLIELMQSPHVGANIMAGEMAKKHRGWNKGDWAMELLPEFNLKIEGCTQKSGYVDTVFRFVLDLQGYEIIYNINHTYWPTGFCEMEVVREWSLDGYIVEKFGKKHGQRVIFDQRARGENAAEIAELIVKDWKMFWNNNFRVKTCGLRK